MISDTAAPPTRSVGPSLRRLGQISQAAGRHASAEHPASAMKSAVANAALSPSPVVISTPATPSASLIDIV